MTRRNPHHQYTGSIHLGAVRIALSVGVLLAWALIAGGAEPSNDQLIFPGKNIGKTYLGADGAKYLNLLPPVPTASEAGMSQDRLVWVSGRSPISRSLYIHTTANGALGAKPSHGVTIDEIRVTSPAFHTREGIKCGSTLAQILAAFPRIRRPNESAGSIYVDSSGGIGFEFDGTVTKNSLCTAVTVFIPGSPRFTTHQQVNELIKNHPPWDEK